MSRLIVWRHGETEWNAVRRVQGHADIELSEVGLAQAVAAAEVLAVLRPIRIVTSDLRRASQTAAALAELTGAPVQPDRRLRERFYGPWQGLTSSEIAERWPAEYARWRAGEPDLGLGIETPDELARRTAAAFVDAGETASGGPSAGDNASEEWGPGRSEPATEATVVVVTHGGAARQGCGTLLGWSQPVIRTLGALGNCRWSELHFDPVRKWQLRAHNQSWTGQPWTAQPGETRAAGQERAATPGGDRSAGQEQLARPSGDRSAGNRDEFEVCGVRGNGRRPTEPGAGR